MAKSSSRRRFIFFIYLIVNLFLLMQVSLQDRTYIYVPSLLNQSDAKNFCREHYTDLASFGSASEFTAMQTLYPKDIYCWIGLQRIADGSPVWIWSDGETFSFTQWYPGEPNNYGGKESCVALKYNAWFDASCGRTFPFMCYKNEPILVKENKTWEEALEACRGLRLSSSYSKPAYDLYQIRSGNFKSAIARTIVGAQTQEVWIGLRFLAGQWLWLNDNPLQLQLPVCAAAGDSCGTITKNGDICVSNCSEKKNFFCSIN